MIRQATLAALAFLALGSPTFAQDSGGVRLSPNAGRGPTGLAQPLPVTWRPLVTASDLQAGPTAADRQARHQGMISKLRGDAGFLGGFSFGTPLAASRQPIPADGGFGFESAPIVINNGPVAITVGNDNVIQQQTADGSGPVAQQQVANVNSKTKASKGAVNLVAGDGTILQQAPGVR